MPLRCGRFSRRRQPRRGCGAEATAVRSKPGREPLEKSNARTGCQLGVALKDVARQRYPRCFSAFREQILAKLNEACGTLLGNLAAIARALNERASALRNSLQHLAEEGAVHDAESLARGAIDKPPMAVSQIPPKPRLGSYGQDSRERPEKRQV